MLVQGEKKPDTYHDEESAEYVLTMLALANPMEAWWGELRQGAGAGGQAGGRWQGPTRGTLPASRSRRALPVPLQPRACPVLRCGREAEWGLAPSLPGPRTGHQCRGWKSRSARPRQRARCAETERQSPSVCPSN